MMQRIKIAVTGGIGSGKTAVCRILSDLGYPVFSCDEISRGLWKDEAYLDLLATNFPRCVTDGKIDKKKLSKIIFSDSDARKRLEALSHPRIMQALMREMDRFSVSFAEVPLLFEGGYESLFDGVLLVERTEVTRIASVMRRDCISEEEVKQRISSQFSDAEREKDGVVILKNDGTLAALKESVKGALGRFGL